MQPKGRLIRRESLEKYVDCQRGRKNNLQGERRGREAAVGKMGNIVLSRRSQSVCVGVFRVYCEHIEDALIITREENHQNLRENSAASYARLDAALSRGVVLPSG